jgi:hypothetical protein
MIIRSNLASAPIKNYSLFLLGCLFLGLLVIGFTILLSLSDSYSKSVKLKESIGNQQRQLQDLEIRSTDLKTRIAKIKTPQFVAETEFMNHAIKRRTFSWTALFDHFEEVLPPSVKMISIVPSVSEENIAVNLEMAGRSLADMLELVRLLERDPQFGQVVLKGERAGEDDLILFSITLNYIPGPNESMRAAATTSAVANVAVPQPDGTTLQQNGGQR